MKRRFLVGLLVLLLVAAYCLWRAPVWRVHSATNPILLLFTPPLQQPGNCASQSANGYYCALRLSVMNQPYVNGLSISVNWNTIETAQGVYNFNAFDSIFQEFFGFNATANCGAGSCVYTLSSLIGGVPLYQVNEQIVAFNFTPAGANTPGGGCTLNAVNNGTQTVTCPSAFSGTATGGYVATACGGARCLFDLTPTHSSYNGNNVSSPTYLFTVPWALSCCSAPPLDVIFSTEYHNPSCIGGIPIWQISTGYGANAYVTGVVTAPGCGNFNNNYYQQTSGGACTSDGSLDFVFPTAGTVGVTSVTEPGGCRWTFYGQGIVANANSNSPTITNAVLASGHAAGWESPWLGTTGIGPITGGWEGFAAAWYAHYSSVFWFDRILNTRWGLVVGGERYLFGALIAERITGGTAASVRSTWLGALSNVDTYLLGLQRTYSPPWQNMAVGNGCTAFSTIIDDTWVDPEVSEAVSNGFNIGTEGIQTSDLTNAAQGIRCTGNPPPGAGNNWVYSALTWRPRITYFQTQTTQQSCPNIAVGYVAVTGGTTATWNSGTQFTTGASWNANPIYIGGKKVTVSSVASATSLTFSPSTTNTGSTDYFMPALDCPNSAIATGDVTRWVPYVLQHQGNLIELYALDAIVAEVATYNVGPTNAEANATNPTWHQVFMNISAGQPAAASGINGTGGFAGQSGAQ